LVGLEKHKNPNRSPRYGFGCLEDSFFMRGALIPLEGNSYLKPTAIGLSLFILFVFSSIDDISDFDSQFLLLCVLLNAQHQAAFSFRP